MKFKWPFQRPTRTTPSQQILHLPAFEILDEKQNFKLITIGIVTMAIVIVMLIGWASYTQLDEMTITFGEIVPEKKISISQHLGGGIIKNILVKNGDTVQKGDLLIELDDTTNLAELQQMQARATVLRLDAERLQHYLNLNTKHNTIMNDEIHIDKTAALISQEIHLLEAQKKSRDEQKSVIESQIQQDKAVLSALRKQFDFATTKLKLLEKERAIDQALLKEEELAPKTYIQLLKQINATQAERNNIKEEYQRIRYSHHEKLSQLKELDAKLQETAYQQLVKTNAELLEVNSIIKKLTNTVERTQIRAPVSGVVNALDAHLGNVITSGHTLMEIVPQDTTFLVETQIDPKDIGYLHPGDHVKIKVLTYDFSRYGAISGTLNHVSASTITDPNNNRKFYRGVIQLDQQYVGKTPEPLHLLPGMSVEADIVTGDKTLLQYLLKPIHLAANSAFRER